MTSTGRPFVHMACFIGALGKCRWKAVDLAEAYFHFRKVLAIFCDIGASLAGFKDGGEEFTRPAGGLEIVPAIRRQDDRVVHLAVLR